MFQNWEREREREVIKWESNLKSGFNPQQKKKLAFFGLKPQTQKESFRKKKY